MHASARSLYVDYERVVRWSCVDCALIVFVLCAQFVCCMHVLCAHMSVIRVFVMFVLFVILYVSCSCICAYCVHLVARVVYVYCV